MNPNIEGCELEFWLLLVFARKFFKSYCYGAAGVHSQNQRIMKIDSFHLFLEFNGNTNKQ